MARVSKRTRSAFERQVRRPADADSSTGGRAPRRRRAFHACFTIRPMGSPRAISTDVVGTHDCDRIGGRRTEEVIRYAEDYRSGEVFDLGTYDVTREEIIDFARTY